jgi:hypothetical protein
MTHVQLSLVDWMRKITGDSRDPHYDLILEEIENSYGMTKSERIVPNIAVLPKAGHLPTAAYRGYRRGSGGCWKRQE